MPKYNSEVVIQARSEKVWPVLSDVVTWGDWLPTITHIQPLDQPGIAMGARYEVHQPKLKPAVYAVKLIKSNSRFAWESRQWGVHTWADHVIEPDGPGQVRVRLSVEIRGILGSTLGHFAGELTRSYLAQECLALKNRVENTPSGKE